MVWEKEGDLLSVAELEFDVLVTIDQSIPYHQTLTNIALLIFGAHSNQIEDLAPLIPAALTALRTLGPGQVAGSSNCKFIEKQAGGSGDPPQA